MLAGIDGGPRAAAAPPAVPAISVPPSENAPSPAHGKGKLIDMKKWEARCCALLLCVVFMLGLLPARSLAAGLDVRGLQNADGTQFGDGIPDDEEYFVTFDLGEGRFNNLKNIVVAVKKAVADKETTRQDLLTLAETLAAGLKNDAQVFDGWDIDLSKIKLDGDLMIYARYKDRTSNSTSGTTIEDEDTPQAAAPAAPALDCEDHNAYIGGYPDGSFRPDAALTRAETASILCRLLSADTQKAYASDKNSFADCYPDAWYNTAVSTLANAGILSGYLNGTFCPNAPITRAELTALVMRFYSADDAAADAFTDISDSWARESIDSAAALGLVHGYAGGIFCPNEPITRAEAVTLMNAVLDRRPDAAQLLPGMKTWTDNADPGAWYYAAVQEAGNAHDYTRDDEKSVEVWTTLRP